MTDATPNPTGSANELGFDIHLFDDPETEVLFRRALKLHIFLAQLTIVSMALTVVFLAITFGAGIE